MNNYPDKHLNNCYEKIAEENDLVEMVDMGSNVWLHKPTGKYFKLTPIGFVPTYCRPFLDKEEDNGGNELFTVAAIIFVIGFVAGLFF